MNNYSYPIRQNITVLPADEPPIFDDDAIVVTSNNIIKTNMWGPLGWIIRETIGVAVINKRGLDKLILNTKLDT